MSGLRYPWTLLGIAPTNDHKVIRTAYAARLKVTRPDEDPAAFQALVEARDAALRQSHYVDDQPQEQEVFLVPATVPAVDVEGSGKVEPARSASQVLLQDIAVVSMPELNEDLDDPVPVEARPAVLSRLETPDPSQDMQSHWASVFDALEQASLSDYHHLMAVVLQYLAADVARQVDKMSDVHPWQVGGREKDRARFGPLSDVLRDFERRFGFLKNDTVLFDYLTEEDARGLISALTRVVGRDDPAAAATSGLVNVVDIHPEAMNAAFGNNPKMLDYYQRARRNDKYPWDFSLPALLFTPFFAFRERLHIAALLSIAALGAYIVILARNAGGANLPYEPLAIGLYVIIAFSVALRWRQMRLAELSRKVNKLVARSPDLQAGRETLAVWGQRTQNWGWGPFILFFVGFKLLVYVVNILSAADR